MGIRLMKISSGSNITPPNPDPRNYKIKEIYDYNNYLVVEINYPGCTTYEGNKILAFKDVTVVDLMNIKEIDPHFSKNKMSPIARFRPTPEGWNQAKRFVINEYNTQLKANIR